MHPACRSNKGREGLDVVGKILAVAAVLAAAALFLFAAQASRRTESKVDPESVRLLASIADRLDRMDGRIGKPDPGVKDLGSRMDGLTAEVAGADGTLRGLRDAVARLRKDATRDAALLDRAILRPSVQVVGRGGVGGGTVIRSEREADGNFGTYVVTAFHVLQKAADSERKPVQVKLYAENGDAEAVESDLILYDERRDLALLKLRSTKNYPIAARLAARERVRETSVFTPIYA